MTPTSAQAEILEEKKTESPAVKSKTWARRLAKILLSVGISLVILLFLAQLSWRFSGSNQWELIMEKNGIRVYSLKAPGSDLLQFKGIGRIHSTLPGIVAWMKDPEGCKIQGCTESHEIERVGDQLQYNYFQYDYAPFDKRDFVIRTQFYQNPDNKEILMNVAAVADRVPRKDGFYRVTNLNNKWRLTPLENGQVEIEVENNLDPGGFVPNVMVNRGRPKSLYYILLHLEKWVADEKYQNAKFDFIKEKNIIPAAHISQAKTP
jgi:hypothetical protein